MTEWAVEIDNLVKKFGDFVAVDHVSIKVGKGEIFGSHIFRIISTCLQCSVNWYGFGAG